MLAVLAVGSSSIISAAYDVTTQARLHVDANGLRQGSPEGFTSWLQLNKKKYGDAERARRFAVYQNNAHIAATHNARMFSMGIDSSQGYFLSANGPFADVTAEEFARTWLQTPQNCSATHKGSGPVPLGGSAPPVGDIDWRTKGVVTPIKSQGHCGSCWTFSTSGTLEAHTCIKHNRDCSKWTGLAEQQLVDCAGAFNNMGCNGGLPSQAFEYIKYNGGMDTEDSYNYTAVDGNCSFSKKTVGATVEDVHNITSGDEAGIATAVRKYGPVSIAYDVAQDFRLYTHGVYDTTLTQNVTEQCKTGPDTVDHAVVVVGLGTSMSTPSVPFYIIRNSWGNTWGMEGYFWMVQGKNMCGISDCASYPIV